MGMRRWGFSGSKERDTNKMSKECCGVGLGLRMQAKESCASSTAHERPSAMMAMPHHDFSHHQPSSYSYGFGGFGDGGCGGCGPMFCETSFPAPCSGGIFDVVSRAASVSGSNEAVAAAKSLQHPSDSSSNSLVFNYSGEMTPPLNPRVPFTAAQWQELERQTIICKYMMASMPVPPELLTPITTSQSSVSPSSQSNSSLEMKGSSHNSDPEPWRCKRTDGKKWRCSRDVAPDQKYCERHSHKSRPRSRKPVELQTDAMMIHNNSYFASPRSLNQKSQFPSQTYSHLSDVSPTTLPTAAASYDQQPRSLEWFLKGETTTVPVASNPHQTWQHFEADGIIKGCDDRKYNAQHRFREDQLDSNSYPGGYSLQTQRLQDQCSLSLNPRTLTTTVQATPHPNQTEAQVTRHFLEAWSTAARENIAGIGNKASVSPRGKSPPLSSLTLSMSGGSDCNNGQSENVQVGSFGMIGSEKDHSMDVVRPQWVTENSSWMSSPPGGPLAEALCLGISSSQNLPTAREIDRHFTEP